MLIVEFNGLPCSGKSTMTKKLIKELSNRGIDSFSFNIEATNKRLRRKKRIKDSIRLFRFKNIISLIHRIFILIKTCDRKKDGICSFGFINDVILIRRQAVIYDRYHQYIQFDSSESVCIVDQGIIQDSIPLIRFRNPSIKYFEYIADSYKNISDNIIMINCNLPKEDAITRIHLRSRNMFTMDKLTNTELQKMLEKDEFYLKKIKDVFKKYFYFVEINSKSDISKNVNELCNLILSIKNEREKNKWYVS